MKKNMYILVIILLGYGKGFADTDVSFHPDSIYTIDEIFNPKNNLSSSMSGKFTFYEYEHCKKPSHRCVDYSFPMNSGSSKHIKCAEFFFNQQNMKTYGIRTIFFTLIDSDKTTRKTAMTKKSYESPVSPINTRFERLQNLNEEDYFSEPLFVPYFKGFGIQISI